MARDNDFRVFRARLDINIANKKTVIDGLTEIENKALALKDTLISAGKEMSNFTGNFGTRISKLKKIASDTDIELKVGVRGGIEGTRKELRELLSAFKEEFLNAQDAVSFQATFDEIAKSFGTTTDQILSKLDLLNSKSATEWKKFKETGIAESQKLYMELVGASIITDLVEEVNDLLGTIPGNTKKNVQLTIDEFRKLESLVIPDPTDLTKKGTPRVAVHGKQAIAAAKELREIKATIDLASKIGETEGSIVFAKSAVAELQSAFRNLFDKTSPEVYAMRNEFDRLKAVVFSTTDRLNNVEIGSEDWQIYINRIQQANDKIKKLKDEVRKGDDIARSNAITKLQSEVESLSSTMNTGTSGIGRYFGVVKAIFGGGELTDRIGQARESLFGFTTATQQSSKAANIFVRVLDTLSNKSAVFAKINSEEQRSLINIASTFRTINSTASQTLGKVADIANKATGEQRKAFQELITEINRASLSYRNLEKAAASSDTGAVRYSFQNVKVSVDAANDAIDRLRKQGLAKFGPEAIKIFQEIEKVLGQNNIAVNSLARNLTSIESKLQKPESRIKQLANSAKETANSFKDAGKQLASGQFGESLVSATKAGRSLADIMGLIRSGAKSIVRGAAPEIKEASDSMLRMSTTARVAAASISVLQIAWGTFIGNLATNVWNTLVGQVRGFFASIKDEFFQANRLVQDFTVTLRQIMAGYSEDVVKDGLRGAQEFITSIIAKTPFTLASGQQAFQQLVTAGFDPREWLEPAADAAAAMNKEMGWLINALQRLRAGSKGMAVDMLRDFGIPVQAVGRWVDSTGELIERDKLFRDGLKLTEEQLKAAGYQFEQWSFDASGSLEIDQFKALDILNGYLKQNEIFAGASAARSKTLTGVLSNLQDTVTKLVVAFGQPIFQALTNTLTRVYEIFEKINVVLEPLLAIIGEKLGNWINSATDAIIKFVGVSFDMETAIQNIANSILTYLKPIGFIFLAVVNGDWQKAWGLVLTYAKEALVGLFNLLRDYTKPAFTWGFELIKQIAQGIISAAKTLIRVAVETVTSVISSFLKPGSPPEQGALSTIDKWGKGLMTTFLSSFKEADLSVLSDITSRIKDILKIEGDEYRGVRTTVQAIIGGINRTGKIDEDLWNTVVEKIGDSNILLKEYIRAQLDLKAIEKEYSDAEAAGFIPKDLQDRLDAAKVAVALKEEDLRLTEEQKRADGKSTAGTDYKKEFEDEKKFLKKKKDIGLITEQDYIRELHSLNEKAAEAALRAGDDKYAKERVKEASKLYQRILDEEKQMRIDQLKKQIEEEKKILEYKYKKGLITEQEYLQGLIGLQEKYIDSSLQEGLLSEADRAVEKLKGLQEEYKKLVTPPTISPGETLASFAEDVAGEFEAFVASIQEEFDSIEIIDLETFKADISKEWSTFWEDFKTEVFGDFALFGTDEEGKANLTTAIGGLLDLLQEQFDKKWTGAKGIGQNIKDKITELWDWLGSDQGPLAAIQKVMDQIATGVQKWVDDPLNQTKIIDAGTPIGKALLDGLIIGFTNFSSDNKDDGVSGRILNIIKSGSSIQQGFAQIGFTWGISIINGLTGSFLSENTVARLGKAFSEAFTTSMFHGFGAALQYLTPYFLVSLYNNIKLYMDQLSSGIGTVVAGWKDTWVLAIDETIDLVIGIFKRLYDVLVGNSIVPDIVDEILRIWEDFKQKIIDISESLESGVAQKFTTLFNVLTLGGFDWLVIFGLDGPIYGGISKGINFVFDKLGELLLGRVRNMIVQKILTFLRIIQPTASGIGKKLGVFILDQLIKILPKAESLIIKLIPLAEKLIPKLVQMWPLFSKIASTASKAFIPLAIIVSLYQNLNRFVTERLVGIIDGITEAIGNLVKLGDEGVEFLYTYIFGSSETRAEKLEEIKQDLINSFFDIQQGILNTIIESGGGIFQLLVSETVGTLGTILGVVGSVVGSELLVNIGDKLVKVDVMFSDWIERSKTILNGLVENGKIIFYNLLTNTSGTMLLIGKAIWSEFDNAVKESLKFFDNLYQGIVGSEGSLSKLYESAKTGLATFITDFTNSITNLVTVVGEKFTAIKNSIQGAIDKLKEFLNQNNPFASDSDSNSDSWFGIPFMGGYAKGTMNVPQDGLAYLHKGEAVIPANIANNLRNVASPGNSLSSTNNMYFAGAFPNVVNASDADQILRELDRRLRTSTLRSRVYAG